MSAEINEKEFSIEIKETLSFDYTVLPEIEKIVEELRDWRDSEFEDPIDSTPEELEACGEFINNFENGFCDRLKITCLSEIINCWEAEEYRNDYNVSIFDEDILHKGIENWIEEEYGFDPRFGG